MVPTSGIRPSMKITFRCTRKAKRKIIKLFTNMNLKITLKTRNKRKGSSQETNLYNNSSVSLLVWNMYERFVMTKTRYEEHINDIRKTITQHMQTLSLLTRKLRTLKFIYFNERGILLNTLEKLQIYDTIRNCVK